MRKKIIALLLSTVMTMSGVAVPVLAEDFSDSAIVFEEETGENPSSETEESDFEAEDTIETEITGDDSDESEAPVVEDNEESSTELQVFTSEPEENLFTDSE